VKRKKVTIKDVADLAGVSFKTVSRVINKEATVGADLQTKVHEAIKSLDYQPNLSARGLRGAPSSVAFIYDNPNSNYVIDLQKGILRECHRWCYELVVHPGDSCAEGICEELLQTVRRSGVGGLILTPPISEMTDVIGCLRDANVAFVRVISGTEEPGEMGPCVLVDDRTAARNIVDHLIGLGHRRIAFLGGEQEHKSTGERLEGYKEAIAQSNLPIEESLIMRGHYSFDSGVQRTKTMLDLTTRPSAVFACNDEIAAGVLFAARMSGVDVPGELSIAGLEDSPFSRQAWPKLTTARQPNETIGARAAELLIKGIRNKRLSKGDAPDKIESVRFVPQLVVRDSTGPGSEGPVGKIP